MQQNTFNHVKTHFSETCHRIIEDHDILLVTQDDAENVVMMPQSLFDSMIKNDLTQQNVSLKIPKLNPFNYAQAPTESFKSMTEDKAELVFADIEDSVAFAKNLRQQAWQRHE